MYVLTNTHLSTSCAVFFPSTTFFADVNLEKKPKDKSELFRRDERFEEFKKKIKGKPSQAEKSKSRGMKIRKKRELK